MIGLDGSQHLEQADYDARRTRYLEEQGYKVVRFFNDVVMGDIEAVLSAILEAMD